MTREDIIRMAREAGMEFNQRMEEIHTPLCDGVHIEDIEQFATLVAAAAKAEENEACAKVCEEEGLLWGQRYAAAIRARGNT